MKAHHGAPLPENNRGTCLPQSLGFSSFKSNNLVGHIHSTRLSSKKRSKKEQVTPTVRSISILYLFRFFGVPRRLPAVVWCLLQPLNRASSKSALSQTPGKSSKAGSDFRHTNSVPPRKTMDFFQPKKQWASKHQLLTFESLQVDNFNYHVIYAYFEWKLTYHSDIQWPLQHKPNPLFSVYTITAPSSAWGSMLHFVLVRFRLPWTLSRCHLWTLSPHCLHAETPSFHWKKMAATNAQSGSASLEDVFGKNPSAWTTSHTPAQPTHKPHPKLAHAHTHAVADLNVQSNSARNWNGCSILPPKKRNTSSSTRNIQKWNHAKWKWKQDEQGG